MSICLWNFCCSRFVMMTFVVQKNTYADADKARQGKVEVKMSTEIENKKNKRYIVLPSEMRIAYQLEEILSLTHI